jgi:hypothetical protein
VTQSNNVTADHLVAQLSGNEAGNEKWKADEIRVELDDCVDHVIGSAAEVEWLWSIVRYILTATCSTLAPMLFEALLFLRANRTLWDEKTVQKALLEVRDKSNQERLEKKMKEAAGHEALTTADYEVLDMDEHEALDSED